MAGWVIDVATLVPMGVMSLLMFREVNRLHGFYFERPDGWRPGPRILWDISRRNLRMTGLWLITVAGTLVVMGIRQKGPAQVPFLAPLLMGLAMRFFPGMWGGSAWPNAFFSKSDYDEPIGPKPDPTPHLRSPEALDRWLDGE